MRVLLDECVDWRLLRDLNEFDTRTVAQMGWRETKNGALLALAAEHFDVFLTLDQNLAFQQNVESLPLAVVIVHGRSTRLADLRLEAAGLREVIRNAARGQLYHVGSGRR